MKGQLWQAMQPSGVRGHWQHLVHSRPSGSMLWYKIDWRHFLALPKQDMASILCNIQFYRIGVQLQSALEMAHKHQMERVDYYKQLHPWAVASFPLESQRVLRQTLNFLVTNALSERRVVELIATFQSHLRMIEGWINWNEYWADTHSLVSHYDAKYGGRIPMGDTDRFLRWVRGAHVINSRDARMLGSLAVPFWEYTREPAGWQAPANMVMLLEEEVPYEHRLWADAPDDIAPHLRPLRDREMIARGAQLGANSRDPKIMQVGGRTGLYDKNGPIELRNQPEERARTYTKRSIREYRAQLAQETIMLNSAVESNALTDYDLAVHHHNPSLPDDYLEASNDYLDAPNDNFAISPDDFEMGPIHGTQSEVRLTAGMYISEVCNADLGYLT